MDQPLDRLRELINRVLKLILTSYNIIVIVLGVIFLLVVGFLFLLSKLIIGA